MEKPMRADKVTRLRGRVHVRPSSGSAHCDAVGAAVDQPGVGNTTATVQRLIMRYYNNVRSQAIESFISAKRVALFGFMLLIFTVLYVVSMDFLSHLNLAWFVQPQKEGMNVGAIG